VSVASIHEDVDHAIQAMVKDVHERDGDEDDSPVVTGCLVLWECIVGYDEDGDPIVATGQYASNGRQAQALGLAAGFIQNLQAERTALHVLGDDE